MSTTAVVVLVVLGIACAAYALPALAQFSTYCDLVARATDRQNERQKFWDSDEGGMNSFEREQYSRLRRGDHMELSDPRILAIGTRLTSRLQHLPWMGVGLVILVIATAMLVPA